MSKSKYSINSIIDFQKEYRKIKNVGSFSGLKSFYKELKKKYKHVKLKDVKEFLMSEDSYTLHKSRLKNSKEVV